ncbi:MAG: DUF378 domain-containing protein [Oscillospiraceae bacterium]
MLKTICLILLIIGGLNWGLIGFFGFDLVAWLCGGMATTFARIIYALVGVAAVVGIFCVFSCDRKKVDG